MHSPSSSPRTSSIAKPVLVLNPGGQYAKKLDTLIRDIGYRTDFIMMDECNLTAEEVKEKYSAIVIAGSGSSVSDENAPKLSFDLLATELPVLGICYGLQLLNTLAWGVVESTGKREDGIDDTKLETNSALFTWIESPTKTLMTHGDSVTKIAQDFRQISTSSAGVVAGIEDQMRRLYGVQFHPESDETIFGATMLTNFLSNIAGIDADFTAEAKKDIAMKEITRMAGEAAGYPDILVYASGGVDSTVLAALLIDAAKLGIIRKNQIKVVHIDHGFMREGERAEVEKSFKNLDVELHVIDAKIDFAEATTAINGVQTLPLSQETDPEKKRKIIGDTFINMKWIIEKQLDLNPTNTILAQWTLWTDIVESREGIKTHHNDTDLVKQLRAEGKILEPLSEFHKPEVRSLGEELNLPVSMVWRHPFPGPGLAIRILCSDGVMDSLQEKQFMKVYNKFNEVVENLTSNLPEWTKILLSPVRTTGVQWDARSYKYMCIVDLPEGSNIDGETYVELAKAITDGVSIPLLDNDNAQIYQTIKAKKKWEKDRQIALADGVNRVVINVSNKRVEDITSLKLSPTHLTDSTADQLRKADAIVNKILLKYNLMRSISQVPVVLLPLNIDRSGGRTIAIRTLITNDFLTGKVAIPGGEVISWEVIREMRDEILKNVSWISHVLYDITGKPPATTEYE
jgi:GMP synthase (glutamine-hydrolysing)